MKILHPTRVVRFNLLAIMLGASIPFAVQSLFQEYSFPLLLAITAFFLNALNFFHGKIVTLENEDYNLALVNRPRLALADFSLNAVVILSFVFVAFSLSRSYAIIVANISIRLLDSGLVLMTRSICQTGAVRRAQSSWLLINVCVIAVFVLAFFVLRHNMYVYILQNDLLFVSLIYLILIISDIAIDYSYNSKFYFSVAQKWDDIAEFWNAMQGRFGDIYRKCIILPELERILGDIREKNLLDLGCGNGCVARKMERLGAFVTAVDSSSAMIAVAKPYGNDNITYQQVNIESYKGIILPGAFDYILACFTLHELASIGNAFLLIRDNLAPSGKAVVIIENDYAFCNIYAHITTQRRWLDPEKKSGKGRRQLIFWNPERTKVAQDSIPVFDREDFASLFPNAFTTISRHWSQEMYLRAATEAGLVLFVDPYDLEISVAHEDNNELLRYRNRPRFRILILARKECLDEKASGSKNTEKPLPLLLLAGISGCGKSAISRHFSNAAVVRVDDFCLAEDDPRVARINGKPDWESPNSYDLEALSEAVSNLALRKPISIPTYGMSISSPTGRKIVDPSNAKLIVVEGLFAFNVFTAKTRHILRILLIPPSPLQFVLDLLKFPFRPRKTLNFVLPLFIRRIARDIREGRRGLFYSVFHASRLAFRDAIYSERERKIADLVIRVDSSPEMLARSIQQDIHSRIHV